MAAWQYKSKAIPVDQGWQMQSPDHSPSADDYTAQIENQDRDVIYLWLHQIDMSFENGGKFAQSARKRDWYARNLTQVHMTLTGRCANQADYHKLCEFIRQAQRQSLRWKEDSVDTTCHLLIPKTNRHQDYDVRGHFGKIDRTSEQFVFAPEYTVDFLIATSSKGVFLTDAADSGASRRRLGPWMEEFVKPTALLQPDFEPNVGTKVAPSGSIGKPGDSGRPT